jgi:hypothetical protein
MAEMTQQLGANGKRVGLRALFDTMEWSKIPTAITLGEKLLVVKAVGQRAKLRT